MMHQLVHMQLNLHHLPPSGTTWTNSYEKDVALSKVSTPELHTIFLLDEKHPKICNQYR